MVHLQYFCHKFSEFMSLSSLQKYINENPVSLPTGIQDTTVIVVSDSKGLYLRNQVQNIVPERNIIWKSVPGRSSQQAVDYIISNVDYFINRYKKVLLLVWTGTCDLTHKVSYSTGLCAPNRKYKKYIDLSGTSVDDIIQQYHRVTNLNAIYGNAFRVLILEVPYYSISIWNFSKGHPNSDIYLENDKILHQKITELNLKIKDINQVYGLHAPRFSLDLIRHRKSNKTKSASTVSYSLLLSDGIHPGVTLSKHWIRRLVLTVICKHCFH